MKPTHSILRKVAAFAVLLSLALSLTACGAKKVDLSDFITVTYEGYNGYGRADVQVDTAGLNAYIEEKIHFKEELAERGQGDDLALGLASLLSFTDMINIQLTENRNDLSNGDTVQVSITPGLFSPLSIEQLQENFEFEFKDTVIEFKVSGLEDAKVFDLLGEMQYCVEYSGVNGIAFASVDAGGFEFEIDDYHILFKGYYWTTSQLSVIHNNEDLGVIYIGIMNADNLSNGDVFSITCKGDGIDALEAAGYAVPRERQITVSGLGEYITSADQFTAEMRAEIESKLSSGSRNYTISDYYWIDLKPTETVNSKEPFKKHSLVVDVSWDSSRFKWYDCFCYPIVVYPDGRFEIESIWGPTEGTSPGRINVMADRYNITRITDSIPAAGGTAQTPAVPVQPVIPSQPQSQPGTPAAPSSTPAVTMASVTGATATSYLSEPRYNAYHYPSNVLDGDLATSWVEGVGGHGTGESLTLNLAGEYNISGFRINAGYQESGKLYDLNSRPAEITVSFSDGSSFNFTLQDINSQQTIDLPQTVKASSVTFTINSVYGGSQFDDTAISEIELF